MKIAIAQLNYITGDFSGNYEKIVQAIDTAVNQQADIVLFAEMSVCGPLPDDGLFYSDFIAQSDEIVQRIAQYAKHKLVVIIGCPYLGKENEELFNAAFFLSDGEVKAVFKKVSLMNQDVLNESRYFTAGDKIQVIEFKDKRIGVVIGEDIHSLNFSNTEKPDIICHLTASAFAGNASERAESICGHAKAEQCMIFSCNQVGGQADILFEGGSVSVDTSGKITGRLPYFESGIQVFDTKHKISSGTLTEIPEKIELVYQALVMGIKDYFQKSGLTKAIVGLSGGVDSALVVTLAVRALGAENVLSVLMPSQYSSEHSVSDALKLVENLGSPHKIVPIEEAYRTFEQTLTPHFEGYAPDVTEENIQARIRGLYLMAFSNKMGYILLNPTNKSEVAVGYGTLYGDMNGAIGVIGDLYKTQVYELCRFINREREIIPNHILTKAPSAELRPDQKDSDSLPEYEVLDDILYRYIELGQNPSDIVSAGHDAEEVQRITRLVNRGEFKRWQTPPYLKVSAKSFGRGRRMPLVSKF